MIPVNDLKEFYLDVGRNYVGYGPTELAKKWGISKQRIEQIAIKLRKAGINIPYIRRSDMRENRFQEAVKELKNK